MKDYQHTGKKGFYWIKFDELQDGRVAATAAGPIVPPGGPVGDVCRAIGETAEEAEKLLMRKLDAMGA